ncbi:MAG: hypothetical protein BWX92_04042 [Deltaproteobacteria bacterium ADurb.Bin135]|nr:MAG: hypothetical protein BWX92_04042 [Deltaproteobacteria bacterium ADurb.Bin135]
MQYRVESIQTDTGLSSSTNNDFILLIIVTVLFLHHQVIHRKAGCYIRQKPNCVIQHIQKTRIGERHWRPLVLPEFHIINIGRKVRTVNQIKPFLHFILINKSCFFTFTLGRKEHI